jgi:hypothetical protein
MGGTEEQVDITVPGRKAFKCPVGWTVDRVEKRIRNIYDLSGGYIQRNNVGTDSTDLILPGARYQFFGGVEKQQSAPQAQGK